jgi:hypothetical protein
VLQLQKTRTLRARLLGGKAGQGLKGKNGKKPKDAVAVATDVAWMAVEVETTSDEEDPFEGLFDDESGSDQML